MVQSTIGHTRFEFFPPFSTCLSVSSLFCQRFKLTVVQISLAYIEESEMVCGMHAVPWPAFISAYYRSHPVTETTVWDVDFASYLVARIDNILACMKLYQQWVNGHTSGNYADCLAQLLIFTNGLFEASNPGDNVYAMLGMTSVTSEEEGKANKFANNLSSIEQETSFGDLEDNSSLSHGMKSSIKLTASTILTPDYTKFVSEVLTHVARYLVEQCRSLDIILHATGMSSNGDFDVPSWVPTWQQTTILFLTTIYDI